MRAIVGTRPDGIAVDPATGTVGDALVSNTWYDAAGNSIKEQPAGSRAFTKTVYDGLGRDWTLPGFTVDGEWLAGETGVGFTIGGTGPPAGLVGYWSLAGDLVDADARHAFDHVGVAGIGIQRE